MHIPTIIWWIDIKTYEKEWLNCIFQGRHIYDGTLTKVIPGAIIVVNQLRQNMHLFSAYIGSHTSFSIVHLSDEFLDDDYSLYTNPLCKHVFRNYIHPGLAHMKKVTHFGIGYKSEVSDITHEAANKTCAHRSLAWSFSGYSKKSDRELLLQMWGSIEPHSIHRSGGFGVDLLQNTDYKNQLLESKFVLCPVGNCSLDTFRIYEALENGCIPITIKRNINQPWVRFLESYWEDLFESKVPFLCHETWEAGFLNMVELLQNAEKCELLRQKCCAFWQKYKRDLQAKVQNILCQ